MATTLTPLPISPAARMCDDAPWTMTPAELARIRNGDEAAFARLVRTETAYLRNYAWRWLWDRDDVEDVVQMTWYRVWSSRSQLTDDIRWRNWITVICRNACLDLRRRSRHMIAFALIENEGDFLCNCPAPPPAREREFSDETLTAIVKLPDRQRLAVCWRYVAGLSTRETADLLGCSTGTVKAALSQALRSLRRALQSSGLELEVRQAVHRAD